MRRILDCLLLLLAALGAGCAGENARTTTFDLLSRDGLEKPHVLLPGWSLGTRVLVSGDAELVLAHATQSADSAPARLRLAITDADSGSEEGGAGQTGPAQTDTGATVSELSVARDERLSVIDLSPWSGKAVRLHLSVPAASPGVQLARMDLRVHGLRPSIVLVIVDTLRGDVSTPEGMPKLSRLKQDGIDFTRAFAHAPLTLPAHTALFSSRYPHLSGVTNNGQDVVAEVPLLGEQLRDSGYRTHAVVSIGTLWAGAPGTGIERGFETWTRGDHGLTRCNETQEDLAATLAELDTEQPFVLFAHYADPHMPYNGYNLVDREASLFHDGRQLDTFPTSEMTHWEREVILEPGENRFRFRSQERFLLRSFECHVDGRALQRRFLDDGGFFKSSDDLSLVVVNPEPAQRRAQVRLAINDHPRGKERRLRYALEVRAVDHAIGELVDALKARGLYDDTLIVVTSDHGEGIGEHRYWGHADKLYEEQLHVPLVIKPPAGHPDLELLSRRRDELVRHVDVAPTLLALAGLPPLPDAIGTSLLEDAERTLLAETHRPEAQRDLYALRDDRYKLIYDADEGGFELYDLLSDPAEEHDRYAELAGQFSDWREELEALAELWELSGGRRIEVDDETLRRLRSLGYAEN